MEHTKSDAEFKQRLIDDPESVLQEFGLPTDPEALLQLTPPGTVGRPRQNPTCHKYTEWPASPW